MVRISKYTKKNLLKYVNILAKKVYLFFYDLNCENFDDVICRLSSSLDIIETKINRVRNESCLIVFSYLNFKKLQGLVEELDSMDIGEFDISEYQDNREIDSVYQFFDTDNSFRKKIYVNKDEKIIQLYNYY